jgi:hypothetical protein
MPLASQMQFAFDALHLLANVDRVAVEVGPAQAEDFAAPHPVQQQKDEHRIKRVAFHRSEKGKRLSSRPRDNVAQNELLTRSGDSAALSTWRRTWTRRIDSPRSISRSLPLRNR